MLAGDSRGQGSGEAAYTVASDFCRISETSVRKVKLYTRRPSEDKRRSRAYQTVGRPTTGPAERPTRDRAASFARHSTYTYKRPFSAVQRLFQPSNPSRCARRPSERFRATHGVSPFKRPLQCGLADACIPCTRPVVGPVTFVAGKINKVPRVPL